ncbi:portal protein [Eikenella corrodens]|uniref:Phage head-tail adapter protein n=1 Tax=Eikenella corrodens TaxID=539 RepID=A0A3S9SGH1_EIKCO|nr:portal protein [Eikenella corrodens]AZR58579.1 phage head-tail adapter protein [Eikenella corrodens]
MDTNLRKRILKRHADLKKERASWDDHWRDISRHLLPRSGRFLADERNRGDKRFNEIYDSTGTQSLRILAAGMMSGMTSPARPWFKLAIEDTDLMQYQPVKLWLDQTTKLMHTIFQRSNTYRTLHAMYEELGAFGTAASIILPDFDDVLHHYPLTVGEYAVATNWKGEVDTLYREFQKTVAETVREFGYDNCSPALRRRYDNANYDGWVTIIHAIEPRLERDASRRDALNMPWRSVYLEKGAGENDVLRESGFRRFPALCPRWTVSGGDIYGHSPGMEALGDIKQLQHEQLRKAQGIDYKTNPPLQVPTSLKYRDVDRLPGGIMYTDSAGSQAGIRPLYEVQLDLNHLLQDIQDVRGRIRSTFYADLFLMLSNQQNPNMTATEVAERHEEKLLMLGPVLERLQNELLDPLIETTFDFMQEAQMLPPPPEELEGVDIDIQLVSMLAQAQQAVATNSIDRFISTVGGVAQFKPEVLDKIDADRLTDVYASALGVDQSIMLPEEQVQAVREQRAQQAQAQQQMEVASQAVDMMHKASQASGSADVTEAFSGYA